MKISFTTLSCPDWNWQKIVSEAIRLGFDGIELRGIEGELFLPKARPFLEENLVQTQRFIEEKGLEICCLDTSCSFHDSDRFNASIEEGKATIDLAQKLGSPYIRVFGNNIPDPRKKNETVIQLAQGLDELGRYAEDKGVCVLLETHGDFTASEDLLSVLSLTYSPAIGVLWDINHPYKGSGEAAEATYSRLGKYIKHVHIKDTIGPGMNAQPCLVGEGDLPIPDFVNILMENGYDGYLSLEWEKMWHRELQEPEIAIPEYMEYIRKFT